MKLFKKISYFFCILASLLVLSPVTLRAATENVDPANKQPFQLLVVCDGTKTGNEANACNFQAFMRQIQKIINFFLYISIPITTFVIVFIGFKYMTAQGDTGVVSESKKMILAVLKGFAFMLLAWLIIHSLLEAFIDKANFSDSDLKPFIQSK